MKIFDGGDEVDSLESVKQEKDFFLITVFDNRGKAQFTLSRGDYLNLCRIGMQELRDDEVNELGRREGSFRIPLPGAAGYKSTPWNVLPCGCKYRLHAGGISGETVYCTRHSPDETGN